ncbi:protein EARLY FLOWERING [Striga asiatica]|uniref:Protein EARLY FLOWERING n=1 Tax=Striga asiatica TaxID=4170 RepID=A0A5A7PIV1_STRAF|nr:protein EARLY FLOWERING [Striga asiatica]
MKSGKEEKIVGPMFPRLHVNDTDKGGPRAPPRNKMALYEQLSIPSNRFTHSAASLIRPSSQFFQIAMLCLFCKLATDQNKAFSASSAEEKAEGLKKQTDSAGELNNNNRVGYNPDSRRCNPFVLDSNIMALEGRSESTSVMDFPSKGQDILHDRSESTSVMDFPSEGQDLLHDDISNKTDFQMERVDSLSENSVVDSISGLDITPDDVVGLIGQEHFWKARREIINQQRIFAVQVFELHRLIKVQRLIAASPRSLLVDFTKPIKASPGKRKSLNNPVKKSPHVPKPKGRPEKLVHKTKTTVENASEKKIPSASIPSFNSGPWGFSPQPLGNHWLIPVMSPSEGLVYKPYTGPGFMGPAYEGYGPPGSSPLMGNFPNPMYGMSRPAFSSSSTGQSSGIPFLGRALARDVAAHQKPNLKSTEDVETQTSFASRSVLPLFPTSPTADGPKSGPLKLEPEGPTRVIKVVPRNARSASESAARIFQVIQEGRKQNDLP